MISELELNVVGYVAYLTWVILMIQSASYMRVSIELWVLLVSGPNQFFEYMHGLFEGTNPPCCIGIGRYGH